MAKGNAPPPVLEGGRLLAYVTVDESIAHHSSRSTLHVDGKLLGRVPRLAICQPLKTTDILLLFCDAKWNVLGVVECASVEEAKKRAEREYSGLAQKWADASVSEQQAERFIAEQSRAECCSFCGKTPHEVTQVFSASTARICDNCVRDFSKELDTNS